MEGLKQTILTQIQATFDFMPPDPAQADNLKPWLAWQVDEFLDHIGPDDLTTVEMMALVGLLGPVFARLLASPAPPVRRRLHAVS